MKNLTSKTCILGNGPTARLCSYFIQNSSIMYFGNLDDYGSLKPIDFNGEKVNLVPIFPVSNSILYNKLWSKKTGHFPLNYFENGDINKEFYKIEKLVYESKIESYANSIISNNKSISNKKNIVLAYKLFGDIIFEHECMRLIQKVNRHYNINETNKRIGYINNLSPYFEKIDNSENLNSIGDFIEKIDLNNKLIITKNSIYKFQKLISTISIKELFSKIENSPNIDLISRPAFFCIIKIKKDLKKDCVFYDCVIGSPIYRVFSISPNILIIQFAYGFENIDSDSIIKFLTNLIDESIIIEYEYRYFLNDAYPLEVSSEKELTEFIEELEKNDIILLGRFAEWKYLDLHEINFSKII